MPEHPTVRYLNHNLPHDTDRDPQDSLQKEIQEQTTAMTDFRRFTLESPKEMRNALVWFRRVPPAYYSLSLPLHNKDISLFRNIELHSTPTTAINNILGNISTTTEDVTSGRPLKPVYDIPGDMTPSSIEDELTHEEPRPAKHTSQTSTRGEISKKQANKYKGKFDMKELDAMLEEAKYRYSYLHAMYRLVPRYITYKPDLDLIKKALQYLFQDYKIYYHLLLKAKSNMTESQDAPETTQPRPAPRPETQPEPETATIKYNLPRTQTRTNTPEPEDGQEVTTSESRQDILKRMRYHRG